MLHKIFRKTIYEFLALSELWPYKRNKMINYKRNTSAIQN